MNWDKLGNWDRSGKSWEKNYSLTVSKTPIVLKAVWDRGVTVATDEARNERGTPQHVCHRANVEAGQARVAGRVI